MLNCFHHSIHFLTTVQYVWDGTSRSFVSPSLFRLCFAISLAIGQRLVRTSTFTLARILCRWDNISGFCFTNTDTSNTSRCLPVMIIHASISGSPFVQKSPSFVRFSSAFRRRSRKERTCAFLTVFNDGCHLSHISFVIEAIEGPHSCWWRASHLQAGQCFPRAWHLLANVWGWLMVSNGCYRLFYHIFRQLVAVAVTPIRRRLDDLRLFRFNVWGWWIVRNGCYRLSITTSGNWSLLLWQLFDSGWTVSGSSVSTCEVGGSGGTVAVDCSMTSSGSWSQSPHCNVSPSVFTVWAMSISSSVESSRIVMVFEQHVSFVAIF